MPGSKPRGGGETTGQMSQWLAFVLAVSQCISPVEMGGGCVSPS